MHDDKQATKRRSARWVQLRNLVVAKMCTAESADVDEVDDTAKRRSVWQSTKLDKESDSDDDLPEPQYEDEEGSKHHNGKHKEPIHEEDNSSSPSVCRRGRKKTKRTRYHRQPISA